MHEHLRLYIETHLEVEKKLANCKKKDINNEMNAGWCAREILNESIIILKTGK